MRISFVLNSEELFEQKRPELYCSGFILHKDSSSHESHCPRHFSGTRNRILPYPPPPPPQPSPLTYSPDLTICDLWIFQTIRNMLRGNIFESREELCSICNEGIAGDVTCWPFARVQLVEREMEQVHPVEGTLI